MSGDDLVLRLSDETTADPTIFVKKDWVWLNDTSQGNYNGNQSVIDTSQLANSNKFLNYKEAYLTIPMLLTMATTAADAGVMPANLDYAIGLKNWFGQIIHSIMVSYNSTTIVQAQPWINFWNHFKLMTTLSWNDVAVMGPTIGFYPDDSLTFEYYSTAAAAGHGVCNNSNSPDTASDIITSDIASINNFKSGGGNKGFLTRQTYINYRPTGVPGAGTYAALQTENATRELWRSYAFNSISSTGQPGVHQIAITGVVYLKHLHSFFEMVPLLKGALLQITLQLNNTSVDINAHSDATPDPDATSITGVSNGFGGTCPFMLASRATDNGAEDMNGSNANHTVKMNLSVGNVCLNNTMVSITGVQSGPLGNQIMLHVPAYTFESTSLKAYLERPVKDVDYTDVFIKQTESVNAGQSFNILINNGIADMKSVLVIPFIRPDSGGFNYAQFQSPFDTAPATTAPLCQIANFNVLISGQPIFDLQQQYTFQEFCNQLYGARSVNSGLTDGLSSSLLNYMDFQYMYSYYYADLSRMPIEDKQIARSIAITGTNKSGKTLDLFVIVEYGCRIRINMFNGSRVSI